MSNDTTWIESFLNLADESVKVSDAEINETQVIAYIQKKVPDCICPECHSRMESKGPRKRKVNHPILQDGRTLLLIVTTRKWHCKVCNTYHYEQFRFIQKFKQNTTLTEFMVLKKLKDPGMTAVMTAKALNVSDTYVHETFMRYVDLPRLPLCKVLAIDEVHMNFDRKNLYAIVLFNWETGEVIDILPNRYKQTIERYFAKIPREELDIVEYLVSDMYEPYMNLAGTWIRNATSVVDCFHHTQPIINSIRNYLYSVRKKYIARDQLQREVKNYQENKNYKTRRDSREVMLLKKYDYLMLKNHMGISYEPKYFSIHGRGGYLFELAVIEKEFMNLDPNFKEIRDLKELYIQFTHDYKNDKDGAAARLEELITLYRHSKFAMFRLFAETLANHRNGIVASFTYMIAKRSDSNKVVLRRISNGPLECYNNGPKDLKRQSNGVVNFEYTRNRLLWINRKDAPILAVPRSHEEVHTEGKKRGTYSKVNK